MINQPREYDLAVVRLGADSLTEIQRILEVNSEEDLPIEIDVVCKQVPREIAAGTFAFIWLGTHNNKGGPTPWMQGLRALGQIIRIEGGSHYNDQKTVRIQVRLVFPNSLTKKDFIRQTGDNYINVSDLPVVGINNYSSQVIQRIDPEGECQRIDLLLRAIADLVPSFASAITSVYPELAAVMPASQATVGEHAESVSGRLVVDIPANDLVFTELLARVQRLLKDGFGGIILRGPPGTSKSYYARLLAAELAQQDPRRIRFVQFHPSYQYEDFMEGLVPDLDNGTFAPKLKHFLQICEDASKDSAERPYVLVIDEFSRTDPARVLGEALTYLEKSKRGEEFAIASGRSVVIPPNLIVIATMNVWDRGIDDVDLAVERRFAHIPMESSRDSLLAILSANNVEEELSKRIVQFYDVLQRDPNPSVRIGHAYFRAVYDESSMHRLWQHQLRFLIVRAFPLGEEGYKRIESMWNRLFPEIPPSGDQNDLESENPSIE